MSYPWPIADADIVLEEALDIALDYLEITGRAFPYSEIQKICARVILQSWRLGTKHRIRLANDAIVVVEKLKKPVEGKIESFYPRAS